MFDWTFISHYAPFFVSGAEMTLFISVFGIILAIVVVFWPAETRTRLVRGTVRHRRTRLPRRLLYGRSDARRPGDHSGSAARIRIRAGLEQMADIKPRGHSTGHQHLHSRRRGLIKESSVVSAIALADVMYMAKDLIGMYYDTYESLFLLIVAYLVILLPISLFGTWLERRFDYERR